MIKKVFALCFCGLMLVFSGCELINKSNDGEDLSVDATNLQSTYENISQKPSSQDTSMYEGMSDEEKLVAVQIWEKEKHPTNLMVFYEDGNGTITNYGITYRMEWRLEDNVLSTDVEIYGTMYDTIYDFVMEDDSYVITSRDTKVSARFYIGGTQSTELPAGGEKDPHLIGKWLPQDSSYPGYVFSNDGEVSGRFSVKDEEHKLQRELVWTVYDYELYVYYIDGPQYVYEYMISGDNLVLYREGESNISYRRAR